MVRTVPYYSHERFMQRGSCLQIRAVPRIRNTGTLWIASWSNNMNPLHLLVDFPVNLANFNYVKAEAEKMKEYTRDY